MSDEVERPILEFGHSRLRHARLGDDPLCGTRSRWKPTPGRGSVTCLKCLGVLARRDRVAGVGLVECGVCGDHVGVDGNRRVLPHKQHTTRKPWCSGFNTDADTLRQVRPPAKGR